MSRRYYLALALILLLATAANAAPTLYELVGVQFNDGGTASGYFEYDPATNLYSNVNITTTTGGVRTGATYNFVCGQDVPTCVGVSPNSTQALYLTSTAANQTGMPGFALFFTGVGGTAGLGTADCFDVSNSSLAVGAGQEASCVDASCSAPAPPSRVTTAGSVCAANSQVRYFSNLNVADSVINISNDNVSSQGVPGAANLCVNVYVFAPDEQPIACCTCPTTPNGLYSLSVVNDLIYNVLTPSVPTSVTVKLIASAAPAGGCSAAAIAPGSIAFGLVAWGATVHGTPSATTGPTYTVTETPFTKHDISVAEVTTDATECRFVDFVGSGFGICKSCRLGGLGADHQ